MMLGVVASFLVYAVFVAALFAAGEVLPGRVVNGTALSDGRREKYRLNGLLLLLITTAAAACGHIIGVFDATFVVAHAWELFLAANVVSAVFAWLLFSRGKEASKKNEESASLKPHFSGSALRDFVVGTQLNPRLFGINVKFHCYRPAMIGWAVLNVANLAVVGWRPSFALFLHVAFSSLYIVDYFWHEEFMLSTWDIVAEHFGLMLCWGDLVFIPTVFGLPAFVLAAHPEYKIGVLQAALSIAFFAAGYAIFRGCNRQKALFKIDPKRPIWGKAPVTVPGSNGRLLASGWWGIARHANYLGDLLLAVSMALPSGMLSVWSWAYPIYLTILLVHRERRDEARCAAKYGAAWREYERMVPNRIVPGVY